MTKNKGRVYDWHHALVGDVESAVAQLPLKQTRKMGRELMASCPYHDDRHPSWSINLDNGTHYCFSCGASGTIEGLLRDMGFGQAAKQRVVKISAGDALRRMIDGIKNERPARQPALPESSLGMYRATALPGWVLERVPNEEVRRTFEIGYSAVDRRVTFPVRDREGRLIGVVGRREPGTEGPKYKPILPTPDEDGRSFDRRGILYGEYQTIQNRGLQGLFLVVVEGYFAAINLYALGWPTVAIMGTQATPQQMNQLTDWSGLIWVLDGDGPGRLGAQRNAKISNQFLATRVAEGYDDDPDTWSYEKALSIISAAKPAMGKLGV